MFTAKDLSRRYRVNETTVWRWRKAGVLPMPIRVGRAVRWPEETIHAFEKQLREWQPETVPP